MRTQIWYPSSGQKMEAGGDVRGMSDLSSREVEKSGSIMQKSSGVWIEQEGYAEILNVWLNFARVGSRPNVSARHHI